MRYANLRTGDEVLYCSDRTSSRDFSLARCKLAKVVSLHNNLSWYAQGGYGGGGGHRTTNQGVEIAVGNDEPFVTLAAHLVELSEPVRAKWEQLQARADEKRREREAIATRGTYLVERLHKLGYESAVSSKETITLSHADALAITEKLEA